MDSLAKIYDTVINKRLELWANIDEAQVGPQKGRGCIEQIMALRLLKGRGCIEQIMALRLLKGRGSWPSDF